MKKIIHVDMDYFYAQVEERDRPELKTKPVGVGGSLSGRGVLCTCNYIARKYGVRGAMPTFMALKKCPDLVLIKPDFKKYKEASQKIFNIFYEYTKQVQGLSLDEAYLDVTDCKQLDNSAVKIAKEIKERILKETGLTASAGVSYNKLLAKISSEINKPDGLYVITPDNIIEKIKNFTVDKINGVGKVTSQKMLSLGIKTFGDLYQFSKLDLINHFGNFGPDLYDYARGIDHRRVKTQTERKSLSVETTFNTNINKLEDLNNAVDLLFLDFSGRMQKYSDRALKTIFVKIKYGDFTSTTIEEPYSELNQELYKRLLLERYKERMDPVRLIGIGVKFKTSESNQLSFI